MSASRTSTRRKPIENGPALLVTKASSDQERYSEEKLERSLRRVGASPAVARKILKRLRSHLRAGMTTREIYDFAFSILKEEAAPVAARYGLRRAIARLGPTGFPFERIVAAIFDAQGFDTSVGVTLKGRCVDHEVDVVATRGQEKVLVECKFHNQADRKCDVKVPLYVHARSLDLKARRDGAGLHDFWLATNTKFSSDAIQYGECVGLRLLSWDYPQGNSLKDLIERYGLHPVTCLTRLKAKETDALLEAGTLLCGELLVNSTPLRDIGLSDAEVRLVLDEIVALLPATASVG